MTTQKLTLYVKGMHCSACTLLTEADALELHYIKSAKSDIKKHTIILEGDFSGKTPEIVAENLTEVMREHRYSVSVEKQSHTKNWSEFKIAIPVALSALTGFVFLQKAGLINLVHGEFSYSTAFVIGIVASLSSCMAVVGGLLLSMSATFAKEGDRIKPQILFHIGRLVSFFLLGGVIGIVGSVLTLNSVATFVITIVISLVMFILGINLLDVFHWSRRLQPSMPKSLSRYVHGATKINHTLTPFVVGIATFFLPCGFTQSMQIYTMSTGSFMSGAFTMGSFALGTLPILSVISFSSVGISNSKHAGVFFKTAGIIVIMFALYNLVSGLTVIGIIQPLFSF